MVPSVPLPTMDWLLSARCLGLRLRSQFLEWLLDSALNSRISMESGMEHLLLRLPLGTLREELPPALLLGLWDLCQLQVGTLQLLVFLCQRLLVI